MAKKTKEENINLDSILFKCRDILRAARNSGSFFEKRDMMLTLVFLRFIGEKFEDGVEKLRQDLIKEGLDPDDKAIKTAFFDDATFTDGTYNLPVEARWSTIINTPAPRLNVALDDALHSIATSSKQLKGCFIEGTFTTRSLAPMVANQQSYERGLEDLKLVCDGYIEDLRRKMPCEKIGQYLRECNEKNDNNAISLFQGVTVDHVFTDPKRVAEDSENGSVVRTGQFAFNKVMKAHNTKLPIALREGPDCVVSNSYQVFEVIDEKKILPKYLILWMNRAETQRYAGFISFGTTRDIFTFENMGEIAIPIPNIETQQAIADIFAVYQKRVGINKQLKAQIKDICPVLIKGSLEEGSAQNG